MERGAGLYLELIGAKLSVIVFAITARLEGSADSIRQRKRLEFASS